MKFILSLAYLILLLTTETSAQRTCGSQLDLLAIQQNDPERYQRIMQIDQQVANFANQRNLSMLSQSNVITIPVVVHVLHTGQSVGSGLNISMAQIQSQIDVLNEDFRLLNADASNTPSAFQGVAADSEFEFVLACLDPNSNPTNGIVRVLTNVNTFRSDLDNVKFNNNGGSNAWPSDRYLNMWVAGEIENGIGQELLGYAQFPDMLVTQPETDGVVIRTTSFGRTGNVDDPFDEGRTATHEVGHWLNLRHIWGDANCGNDFVGDTPTQDSPNVDCPSHPHSSCGSNDMFMNYMDYVDDDCMNIFTQGQATRMQALFAPGGVRESFVNCDLIAQVCNIPPAVVGPSLLCTTNQAFTLQNLPTGVSVSWSVSPANLFAVDTGTGSSFTTRATSSTSSGQGILTATISGDCGNITLQKNVWVGRPTGLSPDNIVGPSCVVVPSTVQYFVEPWPTYFSDVGASGMTTSWVFGSSPTGVSFNYDPNRLRVDMTTTSTTSLNQTYTFSLAATNQCGAGSAAFVTFQTKSSAQLCGGGKGVFAFLVSPNPAQSEITIAFEDTDEMIEYFNSHDEVLKIEVMNQTLECKYQGVIHKKGMTIDVSKMSSGLFMVLISGKDYYQAARLIVK